MYSRVDPDDHDFDVECVGCGHHKATHTFTYALEENKGYNYPVCGSCRTTSFGKRDCAGFLHPVDAPSQETIDTAVAELRQWMTV